MTAYNSIQLEFKRHVEYA